MDSSSINTDFQTITESLLDNSRPFPARFLHSFSDLSPEDSLQLGRIWEEIEVERRVLLLSDLEELLDADTLVCFDDVAKIGLRDQDAQVRSQAMRLLWESDDPQWITLLTQLIESDPDIDVKSSAAEILGKFVLMGELDEISKEKLKAIEDILLGIIQNSTNSELQRRALESLGYSSRSEVPALIKKAYQNKDKNWIITALLAMGRSADKNWESYVLPMIENEDLGIQAEAIRTAGDLKLVNSRQALINKIKEPSEDSEIRFAAIWSLSNIGGEDVREVLEDLYENANDDELEIIEKALENLDFSEDTFDFNFLG